VEIHVEHDSQGRIHSVHLAPASESSVRFRAQVPEGRHITPIDMPELKPAGAHDQLRALKAGFRIDLAGDQPRIVRK
jgi:hypothetical protein